MIEKIDNEKIKEAANLGSERAAKSLFQMTGVKVNVKAKDTDYVPLTDIVKKLTFPKESLVAFASINNSLNGKSMFAISEKNALLLADLLSGRTLGQSRLLQGIDRSAIKETLNILSNSYLIEFGKVLKISDIILSAPAFADTERFIKKETKEIEGKQGNAIVLKTVLYMDKMNIESDLYFIIYN